MPDADRQRFRNEDLVLQVTEAIDRKKWDESRYEPFIDELCGSRDYQKGAVRTVLRYLLGGEYRDLQSLAKASYEKNPVLEQRYGSWEGMQHHLQLPDQLSASLDLATATGKSYVLYGLAAILLAEGAVDRVLVLCPSTTIEAGLLEKFRTLASNSDLRGFLPVGARVQTPRIINASETITEASICVENYHAILRHVRSSIRDSLKGKGSRVAVLNDEAHHVANESTAKTKKWKDFLTNPEYDFRYIVGVSGTCYVGDEYFADVIYRYSLRQAMEERYVKWANYVIDMPSTGDPEEKWQLIYNHHRELKRKLKAQRILPLSIIVTPTITRCKDVADELKGFLVDNKHLDRRAADGQVLVVYNGASGIADLPYVDMKKSTIEWIVAVSMLNEGWDVKRVFQIVPHEERAFNSKLLIAQVLGRGLRIPQPWTGPQPQVTVFNHDAWAPRIKSLVNEVLEIEKRLSVRVVPTSPYHFTLHQVDYTLRTQSVKKPMKGEYRLFSKGYIDLATDTPVEDVSIDFERATTGEHFKWKTRIQHKTYTAREIAVEMYRRLKEAQDPTDRDAKMRTIYTRKFPVDRLETIVRKSLRCIKAKHATESMKQKFLQSLGTLRRKASENVRYTPVANRNYTLTTQQRPSDSASVAELRATKTFFYTGQTNVHLVEEQVESFDKVTEPGSGYKVIRIPNHHDFKTPLSAAIAESENERRFINTLVQPENVACYDAWIKSTATRFYEIDYAWKKGEHPKRGKFSPDFFIKAGDLVLVIEVKGEEELREPAEENRKKNEYALAHFRRINNYLHKKGIATRYKFGFLTERSFNRFFQSLREGKIENFRSELDVVLASAA
jgi:type III restriction enzyme